MTKFKVGDKVMLEAGKANFETVVLKASVEYGKDTYTVKWGKNNSGHWWDNDHLTLIGDSMDNLKVGDMLIDSIGCIVKVQAVIGSVVFISSDTNYNIAGPYFTIDELKNREYTLKDDSVKEMTVADVEKIVGSKVKIVK